MSSFSNIAFANPWFLLLLLLLPLFIYWKWRQRHSNNQAMKVSTIGADAARGNFKTKLRPFLDVLKALAFLSLVIALARPQDKLKEEEINSEGIDIILATDISGSMLARDFHPDRLGACKQMGAEFVDNRTHDRIGMVVFSGESFTQCPITSDHNVLKAQMAEIKSGMVEDGTAIGMGLATSVNRLKDSKAESKVVILLTDGVNNSGFIDPITAAETAREFGIKVYTIGVGTRGVAPYPARTRGGGTILQNVEVQIDEELLERIADLTGGRYFRATDNSGLKKIYTEIDKLEKTEVEITSINRYAELFHPFAWMGIIFLVLHSLLRSTLFRGL